MITHEVKKYITLIPGEAMISLFLAALLVPNVASAANLTLPEFQEKMKKHVASLSAKTTASVQIEVLGKGTELFSHNARAQIIPASNTKLITALAALEKLGSGFSFETKVMRQGDSLILVGSGDPYLVSERLYLLARSVARAGIAKVSSIQVNNAAFAENYKGLIDWDNGGEPFTAMVSPTSLNFNSVEIHVSPNASGKPKVELGPVPHGYAVVKSTVTQVAGNRRNLVVKPLRVEGNREHFELSGTIGKDASPAIVYASVNLPESHIAHAFAALLRLEGITVEKDFGGSSFAPLPAGASLVASTEGPPLLDVVRLYNTFSNNFMTEQIFQAFGAAAEGGAASAEKSRKATKAYLQKWESCQNAIVENGSGLSWNNRISAKCFSDTLQASYRDFRAFADLLGSLPVGGQTGTLRTRFRKTGAGFDAQKVRAKTGTLWSRQVVTSLVGFTQTASGDAVVFSLIENDQRNDPGQLTVLKAWEDKCVEYIQQLQL
jgi:D-alanyl-D-alanine carboxypeptidase/D-alanyl-D-alanine-endopeptidase (penicillin-binding protein 4)